MKPSCTKGYLADRRGIYKTFQICAGIDYLSGNNAKNADADYTENDLAPEVDLNISWDIKKFINLKGGYSMMFPPCTMDLLQGNDPEKSLNASWVWIMVTATPVIYDSSKKKD